MLSALHDIPVYCGQVKYHRPQTEDVQQKKKKDLDLDDIIGLLSEPILASYLQMSGYMKLKINLYYLSTFSYIFC